MGKETIQDMTHRQGQEVLPSSSTGETSSTNSVPSKSSNRDIIFQSEKCSEKWGVIGSQSSGTMVSLCD